MILKIFLSEQLEEWSSHLLKQRKGLSICIGREQVYISVLDI